MKPTIAPLQQSKLCRPALPRDLVRRARLIDELNRGVHLPLTLVSAPAGSGKTTLLSDWLSTCPCPSAWLSLDEEDIELLRHSSQTLHLVLASRSDPALPLAKLRARGQMLEIRRWITGLHLVALNLQQAADPTAFLLDLGSSDSYVMDYLLDEVLTRQSPLVQEFLLETSILDQLNEDLCAAVTGSSERAADGQTRLQSNGNQDINRHGE
jgi:ATP/maltotriose-dependent transcriptional regulator MalT